MFCKYYPALIIIYILSLTAKANIDGEDVHVPGWHNSASTVNTLFNYQPDKTFTVINYDVEKIENQALADFNAWLLSENYNSGSDKKNSRILSIVKAFTNTPYGSAEGEGRWCTSKVRGCAHIKQSPIFRTDKMDCQTFVQAGLALFHSNSLSNFQYNFTSIKYGAADKTNNIHYYNRNNFVSADFNPVLRYLSISSEPIYPDKLRSIIKYSEAIIDHKKWFANQYETTNKLLANVLVQKESDGEQMSYRLANHYPLPFASYQAFKQAITYLPKDTFFEKDNINNTYKAKKEIFAELPTPAVLEVIRDPKKWLVAGKAIATIIGSELNVSHLGFLYKQHFNYKQEITQIIQCDYNEKYEKVCLVTPSRCNDVKGCDEVMFAHVTSAYPNGYYYYRDKNNKYHCEATLPEKENLADNFTPTPCNRVVATPLEEYMSAKMYGKMAFMDSDSILGIHLENLN